MKEEKSKHMLNVDHYYYFYMVNINKKQLSVATMAVTEVGLN